MFGLLLLAGFGVVGGCKGTGGTTSGGTPQEPVVPPVNAQISCGDTKTYTNTSGQKETIRVQVENRCEFSAYLWVYPDKSGKFVVEKVPSGGDLDETYTLEAGGRIEFQCTLVSTVRDPKCAFTYTVVKRG
jgi:hypothetical protein